MAKAKLLNGRINEWGIILPFNDSMDIIYNRAENSLLYRLYKSGKVEAEIELAEFEDGQAAASSRMWAGYTGFSSGVHIRDKMEREAAIKKEKDRIISFFKEVIESDSSSKSKSINKDCKKVLEQIYYDAPVFMPNAKANSQDEPAALPLDFQIDIIDIY